MRWELYLERKTTNRLNVDVTRGKLRRVAAAAGQPAAWGFEGRVGKVEEPEEVLEGGERKYRYLIRLRIEKANAADPEAAGHEFAVVLENVRKAAAAERWEVLEGPSGQPSQKVNRDRGDFVPPDLTPRVIKDVFDGLYERDQHIRVIHASAVAYAESKRAAKENPQAEVARSHVLLKGKPAAAKTSILERFKGWYEQGEEQDSRVLFIDGPTMTKAGLENFLLERAQLGILPDILVLEEIEKQDPNNLMTLISIMGSGRMSKLNARVGHRRELANVLVWATCNDESIIRNFRTGVLWSRFVHKLHCARPSQKLLKQILLDKVSALGGDHRWVDKALEFAFERMPMLTGVTMDDPREVAGLLDGRERLLTGEYQRDLERILKTEQEEAANDERARQAAIERARSASTV